MPPSTRAPSLNALCVFCGSGTGLNPAFAAAAAVLGENLAANGIALVFGGGRIGLMGVIADAVLAHGGKAIGVIPSFLKDKELAHPGVAEMLVVQDMHTRKRTMFERSDAFCILPGGVGTLDEMFEIVTWRQLHLHNKPIIVLNTAGYWSQLLAQFDRIIAGGFAHQGHEALLTVVHRPDEVIPAAARELREPKPLVTFKTYEKPANLT